MYYRNGTGIILIISVLAGIFGFLIVVVEKRWKVALGLLLGLIGWGLIANLIYNIPSVHIRMWLAIPFVLTVPFVLMSGLLILKIAFKPEYLNKTWGNFINRRIDKVKRKKGIYQILIGFISWIFWGLNSDLSNTMEAIIMGVSMFMILFGLQNFFAKETHGLKE